MNEDEEVTFQERKMEKSLILTLAMLLTSRTLLERNVSLLERKTSAYLPAFAADSFR
jgi:hypothetical protein